ncbi:MAG: hypothetical protein ABEN55_05975 [Bradymonadaceae bacterium]
MLDEDQKLRVPEPGEPEDPEGPGGVFVVAAAVSLLLGLTFFLYQYERTGESPASSGDRETAGTGEPSALKERAKRLAVLRGDGLADYRWASRDVLAAIRYGPRPVAERACRRLFEEGEKGGQKLQNRKIWSELLSVTDRRATHAPWSCLFRVFFTDASRLESGLARALKQLWGQIRTFQASGRLVASVIRDFAAAGFFPEHSTFRRWARLCALNFDTHEGGACRELLAAVAPRQGTDLLDTVEIHLRRTDLNPTYDLPILMDGLERLAAEGQPPGWQIAETDALPDYEADLRIGAIFYLCRFVNSPDDGVAQRASKALSRAADYGVRAGDATRRPRWLAACRRAFGTRTDDGTWRAPALAVWTGEPEDAPRYPLRHAIERGDCKVRDGHPRWYCGSAKWNGSTAAQLTDFYVETSGMEWEDEGPLEVE